MKKLFLCLVVVESFQIGFLFNRVLRDFESGKLFQGVNIYPETILILSIIGLFLTIRSEK